MYFFSRGKPSYFLIDSYYFLLVQLVNDLYQQSLALSVPVANELRVLPLCINRVQTLRINTICCKLVGVVFDLLNRICRFKRKSEETFCVRISKSYFIYSMQTKY